MVSKFGAMGAAWAGVVSYFLAYALRMIAAAYLWPGNKIHMLMQVAKPIAVALPVSMITEGLIRMGVWPIVGALIFSVLLVTGIDRRCLFT